jgi:Ca2+-binding EF-hand superfamily protein
MRPRLFLCSFLVTALSLAPASAGDKQPPADKTPPKARTFDVDRFFAEHDKNKDGFLTRDEFPPNLRYAFDAIDANKDGKITKDELQKGIAHLHPRRRPSDTVFVLIELSDADPNAVEELQRIYDVLRNADSNKDGKLEPDELNAARERIVGDRVNAIFEALDTDNDGKISRSEAKGEIRDNFDALDLNKDGYIDRAELMQAAQAKHGLVPRRQRKSSEPPNAKPGQK